jgi:hypothetical protein
VTKTWGDFWLPLPTICLVTEGKQMQKVSKYIDPVLVLFQSVVAGLVLLTLSPLYEVVPHRDSGIFLFIGSQLLKGKLLYQQTWDNKQPLLYAINAAGLWLGRGSAWGVWAVELAFFIITLALMYFLLRKKLNSFASFGLSLVVFLTIYQIMSGNFSEEYAIFFQIGLLSILFFAYLTASTRHGRRLAAVCMGLIIGLVFCIKQTYFDLGVVVAIYLLFLAWLEKDAKRLIDLLWMAAGFVLVNAIVFLYFALHGALNDYLVSAFLINKYYASQGLLEWIRAVNKIFHFNSHYPLLLIMEGIWGAGLVLVLIKNWRFLKQIAQKPVFRWVIFTLGILCLGLFAVAQLRGKSAGMGLIEWAALILGIILTIFAVILFSIKTRQDQPAHSLLAVLDWTHPGAPAFFFLGMIDLPLVALMISLSGQDFPHYYISFFTPLFLLLSASVLYFREAFSSDHYAAVIRFAFIIAFFACTFLPARQVILRLQSSGNEDARSAAAAYLKSVTTPDQKILQWGWESGIYFMADRIPPTRYSFQFPAYFNSPYQKAVLTTLLTDIQADPPAYIADTSDTSMPFIQGTSTAVCLKANPLDGNSLHAILNYVCSNYEYVKSFGEINIFKHIG